MNEVSVIMTINKYEVYTMIAHFCNNLCNNNNFMMVSSYIIIIILLRLV